MTIPSTRLPVTIVSADTKLLCELSWTLSLFGYEVTTSADWSEEAPWRRASQSQLVLLDARDSQPALALLGSTRPAGSVYSIAIDGALTGESVDKLLAAGARDVIRFPINHGELLTRLRSGVRRLEFERRLAELESRDAMTGVASRRGLLRRLERLAAEGDAPATRTLVVCGIDFLELLRQQHGSRAAAHLAAALARCLTNQLGSHDACGVLGEGVLAAVVSGATVAESIKLAETVAGEFAGRDTLVRELRTRPSLSAVVLEWPAGMSPTELLDSGFSTLDHLQSYGGGAIVEATRVQQEIAAWRESMDAGEPFQAIVAQDLVEAFPLVLPEEDLAATKAKILTAGLSRRQPLPPCVPVVDDEGCLLGAIELEPLTEQSPDADTPLTTPPTVSHNEPLSDLFERFTQAAESYLVVVEQNRPVGYITCEGLAALIIDPINATTYRQTQRGEQGLASLVVPLTPAALVEEAVGQGA